ncbi:hypothetical protein QP178_03655 [Sphingomonas aurantiaca]|uniref:hypothetical protein n=1 Tax=Sphingomonas aurantiaca TaxID=185949 RepID=UPI002FE1E117
MLAGRGGHAASNQRRVIVKASIVKLAGKGASAAAAHLRYLQRDETTRDGERGALYGRDSDAVDAKDFRERATSDRHQFRFIVSPEDGDQYDDLKPLTRRLMQRMEEDLGTRLDWVAVDHFNTGHPHRPTRSLPRSKAPRPAANSTLSAASAPPIIGGAVGSPPRSCARSTDPNERARPSNNLEIESV